MRIALLYESKVLISSKAIRSGRIAILDNWDYMQKNLNVAAGSEGTLSRQAEIYAKSYGYPLKLREEIMQEELSYLFNDDYISRISNLFGTLLKDEEKNNIRCQILKK